MNEMVIAKLTQVDAIKEECAAYKNEVAAKTAEVAAKTEEVASYKEENAQQKVDIEGLAENLMQVSEAMEISIFKLEKMKEKKKQM